MKTRLRLQKTLYSNPRTARLRTGVRQVVAHLRDAGMPLPAGSGQSPQSREPDLYFYPTKLLGSIDRIQAPYDHPHQPNPSRNRTHAPR